jgi:hypothetical protein
MAPEDGFGRSRQLVERLIGWLGDAPAAAMTHAELEDRLSTDMREAVRQLYQDHLDLRSQREQPLKAVASATGAVHGAVEAGHERSLATVFGEVRVRRMAYRARGHANLCPADAALNLPEERYSHGLRPWRRRRRRLALSTKRPLPSAGPAASTCPSAR